MVVKGLNLRGVTEFCRAWLRQPELLLPQLSVHDINEISFQTLHDYGFKGIIFDKDNTLTIPHQNHIAPHLQQSFDECKRVFGDRVLIFSNSAGSSDDTGFVKANEIEQQLHVTVLRHNQKKPDGIDQIRDYFSVDVDKLVMIGDRYSTDVLFGNLYGCLTIRTQQFTQSDESFINYHMQNLEKALIQRIKDAGIKPIEHALLKNPMSDHSVESNDLNCANAVKPYK